MNGKNLLSVESPPLEWPLTSQNVGQSTMLKWLSRNKTKPAESQAGRKEKAQAARELALVQRRLERMGIDVKVIRHES